VCLAAGAVQPPAAAVLHVEEAQWPPVGPGAVSAAVVGLLQSRHVLAAESSGPAHKNAWLINSSVLKMLYLLHKMIAKVLESKVCIFLCFAINSK
jgi:hypothetical protein